MNLGVKLLTSAAILCILASAIFLALGAQPLAKDSALQVIYGEGEEFYSDAVVYRTFRNDTLYFLYLPKARPSYRWWTVDFLNTTVTAVRAPRALGSRKYLLRGDGGGSRIDHLGRPGDWFWHFTREGASFSGESLTCIVRKDRSN